MIIGTSGSYYPNNRKLEFGHKGTNNFMSDKLFGRKMAIFLYQKDKAQNMMFVIFIMDLQKSINSKNIHRRR